MPGRFGRWSTLPREDGRPMRIVVERRMRTNSFAMKRRWQISGLSGLVRVERRRDSPRGGVESPVVESLRVIIKRQLSVEE